MNMLSVHDPFFNSIFISYSHKDDEFAKQFKAQLQTRLHDLGILIPVWMDDEIPEGKGWREDIKKHLNSTALIVVIVSPEAIKSSRVMYEWNYSLLVLEDDPFLVYLQKCKLDELKLFTDYQLQPEKPLKYRGKVNENKVTTVIENICKRFEGYEKLLPNYRILTDTHLGDRNARQAAGDVLGNVSSSLTVAGTNYLIAAIQFWFERNHSGDILADISTPLGRLGKRKSASVVVQAYIKQATPESCKNEAILNPIRTALERLTCEYPI